MNDRSSRSNSVAPRHRTSKVSLRPASAEAAFPVGDFQISGTDSLGRSVQLNVTTTPMARRAASKLLTEGAFGFENEQDVWRWCINMGLISLTDRAANGEITGDVAIIQSWNRQAKIEMENAFYSAGIRAQINTIQGLVRMGHATKAVQLAEFMWQQHDLIEDPYWRADARNQTKKILDYARLSQIREDHGRRTGKAAGNGRGNGRAAAAEPSE